MGRFRHGYHGWSAYLRRRCAARSQRLHSSVPIVCHRLSLTSRRAASDTLANEAGNPSGHRAGLWLPSDNAGRLLKPVPSRIRSHPQVYARCLRRGVHMHRIGSVRLIRYNHWRQNGPPGTTRGTVLRMPVCRPRAVLTPGSGATPPIKEGDEYGVTEEAF